MIWVPSERADRSEIERALERAYPTKTLDALQVAVLDSHLPLDRMLDLFKNIASAPALKAVFEVEIGKSHVVHIGSEGVPDWEQLNREFTPRERLRAVAEHGGEILYWNILLSRIAPFWAGYWNSFRVRNGKVFPDVVAEDTGSVWTQTSTYVRSMLASYGLHEVSRALLDSPIPWLRIGTEASERQPSVYDALFSDVD